MAAPAADAVLARWAPAVPDPPWAELRAQALRLVGGEPETGAEPDPGAAPPGEPRSAARARCYAEALCAYFAATRPRYPVDPRAVASNPFLWGGPDPPPAGAHETSVLVDPAGVVYADPVALLRAAAEPSAITQFLGAAGAATPTDLAPRGWIHPPGEFPFRGALWAGGGALLSTGAHPRTGAPAWARFPDSAPFVLAAPAPASPPPGSALKGAQGEARVAAALEAAGYSVASVAHRARSADLAVSAGEGEVYVESKDYSAPVPEKEVKKFLRDLGARGAAGGVLVSLASGISGVRGGLSARTEALPGEGRLAPVVYVSRGGADAAVAAVDLAVYLARRHPPPLAENALVGPGGYDRLEAFAAELDQLGGLYEAARADLAKLSSAVSEGCGATLEQLGFALRDHRRLTRCLRGASEGRAGALEAPPSEVWAEIRRRYAMPEEALGPVQALVGRLGGGGAGDPRGGELRPLARWKFLKTRASLLDSEIALSFTRGRAEICLPLSLLGPGAAASRVPCLLGKHSAKVRVGDGALALELDAETAEDALALW